MSFAKRELNYILLEEDGMYVARCLDVEVTSDGQTEREAVANLQEALEVYFESGEISLAGHPLDTNR